MILIIRIPNGLSLYVYVSRVFYKQGKLALNWFFFFFFFFFNLKISNFSYQFSQPYFLIIFPVSPLLLPLYFVYENLFFVIKRRDWWVSNNAKVHLVSMHTWYFRKTWSPSYSHNLFVVKKTFQKCNPPDFEFYLGKLNDKKIPIWCNVNFESVFIAINNTKKQRKFNITPYGENVY